MFGHRIRRRAGWVLLVGAALLFGTPLAAGAGKGAKAPVLQVGGRTIGGPGTLALADDESWEVWTAESGMAVCVTALNAAGLTYVDSRSANVISSTALSAGEQTSICRPACEALAFFCEEGPCRVSWRVDQMR